MRCAKLPRMRPLLKHRTPAQLLWAIVAANGLVSLSFGALSMVSRYYPHRQNRPLSVVLCSFGIFALGLIGTLIAESNLKNGIGSKRWPDSLLAAPRKVVAHPVFSMLPWMLIIASFVYIIVSRSGLAGSWMFLYPAMSLSRVIRTLHPRDINVDYRRRMDPPKPLQSEHWGTPPRPFSN